MTRHTMVSISRAGCRAVLALGIAFGSVATVHADTMPSLFNGLVFAHDMENAWLNGATGRYNIAGVHGTPTAEVYLGALSAPFSFTNQPSLLAFSQQHLKTPPLIDTNNPRGYFDTNTQLTSPISQLSFSVFYNIDPQASQNTSAKRFVTTYIGGTPLADELLFDALNSSTANHSVRLYTDSQSKTWANAVTRDGTWHHVGFVFDYGVVSLYVDGQKRVGEDQTFTSTSIAAQNKTWRLLEETAHTEFFMNSSMDEAGLWYRALSEPEMLFLYQNGLAAIPEPSTLLLLAMAGLGLSCRPGRRRK